MIQVGSDKQLFIDHRFIKSSENVALVVNPPVKQPDAILRCDKPWDGNELGWNCLLEDDGVYKMWYHATGHDQWDTGTPTGFDGGGNRLCYAVSQDGLTWEKPNLGLVEYKGSMDNNIVLENSKLAYVFIDPHGKPEERYKMVELVRGSGIRVGTSADGLHWELPSDMVSGELQDTTKQAWWEPRLNKYVVYLKLRVSEENVPAYPFVEPIESNPPVVAPKLTRQGRSLGRIEVDDITQPWPDDDIRTVLTADEHDPPDSDIYHHDVYPYPYAADAYFIFPMTYQHFRESESTGHNTGLNDVQFGASRDGIHWMRYDRRPYIPRGLSGERDCGGVQSPPFHIRKGNYLYQCYERHIVFHGGHRALSEEARRDKANWGQSSYGLVMQRLDGFVSADAAYTGGWLVTPPIIFQGDHLELNIDVAAMGEAMVEVQDENGQPVPGFTLEECDRVLFNDVAYTVKWKGKSDVSSLAGKPVRLRMAMRSAKLYAFQFAT